MAADEGDEAAAAALLAACAASVGEESLALAQTLLRHGACPRCVLRFCAVADAAAYAARAPSAAALRRAAAVDDARPAHACPCCWGALEHVDAEGDAVLRSEGAAPGEGAGRGELERVSAASARAALRCGGHDASSRAALAAVALPPGLAVAAAAQAAALGRSRVTPVRVALSLALAPALARAGEPQEGLPAVQLSLLLAAPACDAALLSATGLQLPPAQPSKKRRWHERAPPAAAEERHDAAAVTLAVEVYNGAAKRAGALAPEELAAALPAPFAPPAGPLCARFLVLRPPFELGGYYCKPLRGLSQSPWLADEQQVGDGSVSGHIEAALRAALRCDALKFVAAGREDMDVRMLGGGRPFLLEASNARCGADALAPDALAALARALGATGRVAVRALAPLSAAQRGLLREGEAEKAKAYRALVWLSRPLRAPAATLARLAALGPVELAQRTPVRVLHRRAPLTRARTVHGACARALPGGAGLLLDLRCAAGTYVKEFVHGDWGRTRPGLAELLRQAEAAEGEADEPLECDCLQLDVREVEMEWL